MAHVQPPRLIVEERDGYLYVEYAGNPLLLDALLNTINTVGETLRRTGLKRVLIVRDAPLLENDENRALVANLVSRMVGPEVLFAIVDHFGNDREQVIHAAEASRAAGWNLTHFDTVEEAAAWLSS